MTGTKRRYKWRRRILLISAAVLLGVLWIISWAFKINGIISNLSAIFTIILACLSLFPENSPSLSYSRKGELSYIDISGITPNVLGLTKGMGALIVYADAPPPGSDVSIDLFIGFNRSGEPERVEQIVKRRMKNHRQVFVAIFPVLPVGKYLICSDILNREAKVSIYKGGVKELNWRQKSFNHNIPSSIPQQQPELAGQ